MAAIHTFSDINVKIGDKVIAQLEFGQLCDKFYLLLNRQIFEFPIDNWGEIPITDYLVQGRNHLVFKVKNITGGPFGEPSKWCADFSLYVKGKKVVGPHRGEGDDWYSQNEHVVLEGYINAQF